MSVTFIEVVEIPVGPAPEEIRREWVGLKLVSDMNGRFLVTEKDIKRLAPSKKYRVPWQIAIQALEKKNSVAVEWFRKNFPSKADFFFQANEVKEISLDRFIKE